MSSTRTRSGPPGRTTKRERAELQSQAARARQDAEPGGLARALSFWKKPDPDTSVVVEPARWRTIAALVLSICGLGVSIYLTVTHFDPASLVCSGSGIVNCAKVTTSAESYFLGVPVAIWGLVFWVPMTAVNLPVAWRSVDPRIHVLRLAMAALGICFVLYLVSAELLIIGNICLWCTSVHVVTFLVFVLILTTVPQMLGWGATAPARDWTG